MVRRQGREIVDNRELSDGPAINQSRNEVMDALAGLSEARMKGDKERLILSVDTALGEFAMNLPNIAKEILQADHDAKTLANKIETAQLDPAFSKTELEAMEKECKAAVGKAEAAHAKLKINLPPAPDNILSDIENRATDDPSKPPLPGYAALKRAARTSDYEVFPQVLVKQPEKDGELPKHGVLTGLRLGALDKAYDRGKKKVFWIPLTRNKYGQVVDVLTLHAFGPGTNVEKYGSPYRRGANPDRLRVTPEVNVENVTQADVAQAKQAGYEQAMEDMRKVREAEEEERKKMEFLAKVYQYGKEAGKTEAEGEANKARGIADREREAAENLVNQTRERMRGEIADAIDIVEARKP